MLDLLESSREKPVGLKQQVVQYLLHTGEVVYGDVDLQLITKPKKSWKENNPMEEVKRSIPKFKRGDKVKIMRDEVYTIDEVVTTENKRGITHEYFVDDDMDLLQENELILVELDSETNKYVMAVDGETTKSPKKLLKDGMFVIDNVDEWYIVVNDKLICWNCGYHQINSYDDDLLWRGLKSHSHYIKAIVEALSFNEAKSKYERNKVVWKRTT